jgi:hypothetical protein
MASALSPELIAMPLLVDNDDLKLVAICGTTSVFVRLASSYRALGVASKEHFAS